MIPILQTLDISQYEFEEFCDKWAFTLFEKAKHNKFNGDYDQFWEDFESINPNIYLNKYEYTTKLGTNVRFYPSSMDRREEFWEYKVNQREVKV